jgi:hypothetical protein
MFAAELAGFMSSFFISSFFSMLFEAILAGLALVFVVIELVVVDGEPFVTVVVDTFVVLDVPLALLVVVVVLLTELPVLLTLAPLSGQAAPNKPNVKTAERAITFFISIKFSCLLQRMLFLLYCLTTVLRQSCSSTFYLEHWTI